MPLMKRQSFVRHNDMKEKLKNISEHKNRTLPILAFPSATLLGITARELISSPEMQLNGMKAIAENCTVGASLNMMDLSLEAEAFGAKVRFYDDDIPAVEKGIIDDITKAEDITVPEIGAGRTGIAVEGIRLAKKAITDKCVFCGVIGPYSLAGRLFDMTELMMECYDNPQDVGILLSKSAEFIISYIKAFKAAGADGVIMAEPAAGLLSPTLAEEFSMPYVKQIFEAVNSDDFILCYHNCGSSANDMLDMIADLGADIVHLGNAVDLKKAMKIIPSDTIVMGNADPVLLKTGTKEDISNEVQRIFDECCKYDNFMISTGCDVPAKAKWENINEYFKKVNELYA